MEVLGGSYGEEGRKGDFVYERDIIEVFVLGLVFIFKLRFGIVDMDGRVKK